MKAAFTRAYQKNPPMLPYAINSNATAKKRSMQNDDLIEEEDNEEEDDNIESDKMIKVTLKVISIISLQDTNLIKRSYVVYDYVYYVYTIM